MMGDDSANGSPRQGRESSPDDLRAGEEVLLRLQPSLGRDTQEYRDKLRALAEYRAKIGVDDFDLHFGLRQPRNRVENLIADLCQGRISDEEFAVAAKRDAERPADAEMLEAFCNAYEERLQSYSQMLQAVIGIATDQRNPHSWREREPEVDRHVETMEAKLPLWKEQVATVFTFLAELRAERSGEPVRCGDHSAESAHMLASRVMDHAAAAWRSSKEIAQRSRTDPRYLYATSASNLFYEAHLPGLPRPNDLMSRLVLERVAALHALRERVRAMEGDPPSPSTVNIRADVAKVTAPSVQLVGEESTGGKKSNRKIRTKREANEPLILRYLQRRPHDTAKEVAQAVGCSVGVVAESPAWKANQHRLKIAAEEGRDPKAVRLNLEAVNAAGWSRGAQHHEARRAEEARDDEIDRRERELFERIGEYEKQNPGATPEEVALALGCTAGDVERRQVALNQLIADQAESDKEDDGGKYSETGENQPRDDTQRKWIRKQV